MQRAPRYDDVVAEVKRFLEERMAFAVAHGVAEDKIILDPGSASAFGKDLAHNLELLRRLPRAGRARPPDRSSARAASRSSASSPGRPVEQRLAATIATNVIAYERGARIFRVHDVAPVHDALGDGGDRATVARRWH